MTKVVVISGAGKGIGATTAIHLAKTGYTGIVLVSRTQSDLDAVAKEVKQAGAEPLTIVADLIDPGAPKQIIEQTINKFGQIDALINNAGAVRRRHLLDLTDEDWDDGLAVKLHSARRLTVHAWPYLKQTGGAVLFLSGASYAPDKITGATSATNAAVNALSKAFADQGISETPQINVNTISPSAVLTPRLQSLINSIAESNNVSIKEAEEILKKQRNIPRLGNTLELAQFIEYILSDKARFIDGTNLRFDSNYSKNP